MSPQAASKRVVAMASSRSASMKGLTPDSVVDQKTWQALEKHSERRPAAAVPANSDAREHAQP